MVEYQKMMHGVAESNSVSNKIRYSLMITGCLIFSLSFHFILKYDIINFRLIILVQQYDKMSNMLILEYHDKFSRLK